MSEKPKTSPDEKAPQPRRIKIPDAFVIVYCIIILAAAATWVVPGGSFQRETTEVNGRDRQVIVKDSFAFEENQPQLFAVFEAPLKGIMEMSDIVGFIFLVGGAFFLFNKTGAISASINEVVRIMKGREKWILVLVMLLFSFFGASFGMCEEAIPFVLIMVPLALAMGYDSLTGLCLSFLAAGVGFATAFFNPFTVQIAQKLSHIRPVSGLEYRLFIWLLVTGVTIAWVVWYAERVKKNPKLSLTCEQDRKRRAALAEEADSIGRFNTSHGLVMLVLFGGLGVLFWGVLYREWYIDKLAALFLAMGILAGFLGGLNANQIAQGFVEGARDICGAALIVGFAKGIVIILEDGHIMDTILYAMSKAGGESSPLLSTYVMYWVQTFLNFFLPSGTTKAALTMPIFAPLADLTGIARQTAVLAYQFGDGFTNMIFPTSGVTVGTLVMAKVPFEKWFRFMIPLQIIFFILASLLLIPPVYFPEMLGSWLG